MSGRQWYLLYSKPRQEALALAHLSRQGYEAYLPRLRVRRRAEDRSQVVQAMFSRYLFVHLDPASDDWGPIRSTTGVTGLVRFGQDAARVPDSFITALRANEDEGGLQRMPPRDYAAGARVRVVAGPIAGYEAVFHARTGRERVILLLHIAGQTREIDIHESAIEPA